MAYVHYISGETLEETLTLTYATSWVGVRRHMQSIDHRFTIVPPVRRKFPTPLEVYPSWCASEAVVPETRDKSSGRSQIVGQLRQARVDFIRLASWANSKWWQDSSGCKQGILLNSSEDKGGSFANLSMRLRLLDWPQRVERPKGSWGGCYIRVRFRFANMNWKDMRIGGLCLVRRVSQLDNEFLYYIPPFQSVSEAYASVCKYKKRACLCHFPFLISELQISSL